MLKNSRELYGLLTVVLIAITVLSLMSCRGTKGTTTTTQTYEREVITEVIRDTVVKVEQDRATLQALLECDERGTILIKQLAEYEVGKRLKPPKVEIKNNVLTATAEADSVAIYLTFKDRYTEKTEEVIKEVVRIVEVNVMTGWQKFRLWIGTIVLFLIPAVIYLKTKKII